MISADVKADVKQQEIKELVAMSCNFLKEVPSNSQNLKYTIKQACTFHLILVSIPYNVILSPLRRRGWVT